MLYRNYQLNKTHSALKFGRADGYPLVLSNAKSAPVRKLEVSGNSYQATRGKNLFNVDAITSTYGGYVENGTIYVTGYPYNTAMTPEQFLEMTGLQEGDTFTADCEYTQISATDGTVWGVMRFDAKASGYSSVHLLASGKGMTVTIPEGFNSTNYTTMYIYSGRALEDGGARGILRNFAIYKGTYTSDTMPEYEPYVEMPSPDHPSEVLSVGDRTQNLFDMNAYKEQSFYLNNISKIGETALFSTNKSVIRSATIMLNKNTDYTISKTGGQIFRVVGSYEHPIAFSSTIEGTLIAINDKASLINFNTGDYEYITLNLWRSSDNIDCDMMMSSVQLLEGTYTADTMPKYEPYGYRVPIECRGYNLVNVANFNQNFKGGTISDIDPATGSFKLVSKWGAYGIKFEKLFPDLEAGKEYYLFCNAPTAPQYCYLYGQKTLWGFGKKRTITQEDIDAENGFGIYGAKDGSETQYSNVMIIEASIYEAMGLSGTPPYEPYYHDTVNIYTDKPLYGIDDYTDSITLDFEKKKAVRTDRIKEIMLYADYVYRKLENVIRFQKRLYPYLSYKGARMMCDKLLCLKEGGNAFTSDFECLFMHDSFNNNCYFSLNKTRIGAEDTDTDSQLIEKANAYLADNPITAYYKLGTPIETDISDTIDWDKLLHLSRHTNILSSSTTISPSNLCVKYIRK